jgi:hypothetical protein
MPVSVPAYFMAGGSVAFTDQFVTLVNCKAASDMAASAMAAKPNRPSFLLSMSLRLYDV